MDRQPGSFGLGGSLKYEPTDGSRAFATVFIYDLGQHRSPDGADSQDAVAQMRQAAGDIEGAVRLGRYRSAMPAGSLTVPGPDGATRLRCETYRVVQLNDLTTSDGVCVSILQGRYQKVRLTSWLFPDPRQAGMQAAEMLSAMIDAQSNPKSRADEAVESERGARD